MAIFGAVLLEPGNVRVTVIASETFVGDSVLRAVICEGEGKWYIHNYDEFFLFYKGDVVVQSNNSSCKLKPGTGVLVPAGVRHRTNSKESAIFIVFRHKQTACMPA